MRLRVGSLKKQRNLIIYQTHQKKKTQVNTIRNGEVITHTTEIQRVTRHYTKMYMSIK